MLFKFAFLCLVGMAACQVGNKDPLPLITTTDVPDTTTSAANTTIAPETTTLPPDTTTTPVTTTSTAAPTTPAPVTPVPPPQVGTWNVTVPDKNETCIMAKMAAQISITYSKGNNVTGVAILDIPTNTSKVEGSCGNETQWLKISWIPEGLTENQSDSLLLEFTLNTTSKTYHLTTVNVTLYPDSFNFPGAASQDVIMLSAGTPAELPTAAVSMSYRCLPEQKLNLTGDATLTVSQMQLQAFHEAGEAKFGAVTDCQAADSADIVPIAVGCALAGLVVIVLIAYLIGRRRSHAKGYLSM